MIFSLVKKQFVLKFKTSSNSDVESLNVFRTSDIFMDVIEIDVCIHSLTMCLENVA